LADNEHANGTEGTEEQSARERDEMTTFGISLATLFGGGFFVFCAFYLGPYPAPLGSLVKWVCLILAVGCVVFGVGFWGVGMRQSPEMGTFLKAIWGGGDRGWRYLGQTTVFVAFGFAAHLMVAGLYYLSAHVDWLGWVKYIAWVGELGVVVFALFASVLLAFAFDAFFISPILERTAKGGEALEALVQTMRTRGPIVVSITIALIALWVELFR
jgi:hypothetical protein